MDNQTRRQLKQIAHHLHPIVTVGDAGVSAAVIAEADRTLKDHELIKVKIHGEDRDERELMGETLAAACTAAIVQKIGKVIVLFRRNPEANPNLSNLARSRATR
ncbi:MAG: ribosome assembly RNA-binding protein YhbY [Pseudomonadales bacterium]